MTSKKKDAEEREGRERGSQGEEMKYTEKRREIGRKNKMEDK